MDSPEARAAPATTDPDTLLRSREYLRLLVLAAALGLPISGAAYGYLTLIHYMQEWVYDDLPRGLGLDPAPSWWPVPLLAVAGILVGLCISRLPGSGGRSPAQGFHAGGAPTARELPGIALAALAGLGLGVVLGPEAPLIALGGGLAVLALRPGHTHRPQQVVALVGAVGSLAAIATLLGSPIVGAFLVLEAAGISGPMIGLVLIPGLLAAGFGSLIFLGLGAWSGLGPLSLAIPDLAPIGSPSLAQFGWAIAIGLAGALVGTAIRRSALLVEPIAASRIMLLAPLLGVVMALLAFAYAEMTGHSTSDVLFSGQDELPQLLQQSASYSVGALSLLVVCKALAYIAALSGFRGGPIFPSMYIGAAGGLLLSHLPGLPAVAGAAMGIAAVCVTMLRLPLTSVMLTTLFLGTDGIRVMPLVIVAAVVAFVVSTRLNPPSAPTPAPRSE
jgi:H+/Cl- antiporter ClcA